MVYNKEKVTKILNETIDKLFELDSYLLKKSYDKNERPFSIRFVLN